LGDFLIFIGLATFGVGIAALVKGSLQRLRIANRKQGAAALVIGFVVMTIGGAIAGPAREQTPTANPSPRSIERSPSPSLSPSPSPSPPPVVKEAPPPPPPPEPEPSPTATTGVYNNPWGYNFESGELIYNPPSNFCNYFPCIGAFWDGKGYVAQCEDDAFSKSGGRQGACSHHGGVKRPLYSPPESPH
jgi:hypothetical protein